MRNFNSPLWTHSGGRLRSIAALDGRSFNWVFLPGGPGLGSEVLTSLTGILKLPGTIWHLDLPQDGSNIPSDRSPLSPKASIAHWSQAIFEAATSLENVIFVGHSRGGMFGLAVPELEKVLKGVVLLDAAPDMAWQEEFAKKIMQRIFPEAKKFEEAYLKSPNNESLKQFVLAGAPYMFTKEGLEKGIKILENLPYNYKAIQWTQENFDPTYQAKWIPKEIPAMILSGSDDLATPLKFFAQKKEFVRPNILMKEIPRAGHFPWIENPKDVIAAFEEFCARLLATTS